MRSLHSSGDIGNLLDVHDFHYLVVIAILHDVEKLKLISSEMLLLNVMGGNALP